MGVMTMKSVIAQLGGKMENRKQKREFCDGLKQLEARLCILERERNAAVFGKRSDYHSQGSSLEEYEHQLSVCRKAEKHELQEQIQKVKGNVSKLQTALSNLKTTPAFVEKLKVTMENIESSILLFKEKQQKIYEELLNDEQVTSQEIVAFEKRMESWSKSDADDKIDMRDRGVKRAQPKVSEAMPPAVVAFEKFLQSTGGHTGGWDEYDHQIYLRTHVKHHDAGGLLEDLAHQLPARTPEDLDRHHQWYLEYSSLLRDKKAAILQWKEQKKVVKRGNVAEMKDDDMEEKEALRKKALAKEREERQAKLAQWKAEQLQRKSEEEEERLAREKAILKAKDKEKQRQLEVKKKVDGYVKQKEVERREQQSLQLAQKEREKEMRKLANKEIARFRERDMKIVEEKLELKQKEDQERLEKEQKLAKLREKVEVNVSSDPGRLYRLTAGWEERKKQRKDPLERGVFSTARDVPHRAVPTWRQGL